MPKPCKRNLASAVLRTSVAIAALFLATAASPPSAAYLISAYPFAPAQSETAQAKRLSTMSYTAAPVPNVDASAPAAQRQSPSQASLVPSLFAPRNAYHGEGYVPGSTVQTQQEKRVRPAPGIALSVPLQ